jgi:hypothetical protein
MAPPRKKNNTTPLETQARMQTRATNSNKHPGAEAQAALRVRRDPTVVQKEKDVKQARKEAKEQQVAQEATAETELEEYRSQQKIHTRNEDNAFPRQRSACGTSLPATKCHSL